SGRADRSPEFAVEPVTSRAISPNGDGVQDAFAVSVTRGEADGRPIVAAELAIYGRSGPLAGELVARQRVVSAERAGILARVPFIGRSPELLPLRLEWRGSFSGAAAGRPGERVPDGDYLYQVTVFDDRRAARSTAPIGVTVDTEPPRIHAVGAEHLVFSPNGDGLRDTVTLELSGSSEAAWTASVLDADGESVRVYSFAHAPPQPVTWDGRDAAGDPLPDGRYRVVLRGTDAAGNRAVSDPAQIILTRRAGEVRLSSATPVVARGDDGVVGRAELSAEVATPQRVAEWRLLVTGPEEQTAFVAATGLGAPPADLVFDPRATDGTLLPDGVYRVSLEATLGDGSIVRSAAIAITVNVRGPTGVLRARTLPEATPPGVTPVFGTGTRARLQLSAELDRGEWYALVTHDGETRRIRLDRFGLHGDEPSIVWDGSLPDGSVAPDGDYEFVLVGTDDAGNEGRTNSLRVVRDTSGGRVGLTAERTALSPNGDGVRDTVEFSVGVDPRAAVERLQVEVTDASGRPVRSMVTTEPVESFRWAGLADTGEAVPDGTYRARVTIRWRNGAGATAVSAPVAVDTTPPRIRRLAAPYRLFSPDGDGERDTVRIEQVTSDEPLWVGRIVDRSGAVVFERRWEGVADSFAWDGRDSGGEPVADGDYTYELCATDAGGNAACDDLTFVIDTTSLPVRRQPPVVSLSAAPDTFTPDGDGTDDLLLFGIDAESPNELESWAITLSDRFGREFRRLSGEGAPPSAVRWDGRSPLGELVESAEVYAATLRVVDVHGNEARAHARVRVGILLLPDEALPGISVPPVAFPPGGSDLHSVPQPQRGENFETLRSLAEVLRRYPDREILIEGHAAHDDRGERPEESRQQRVELVALSQARAEAVRRALVVLGVEDERLTAVGVGGARPVVPHGDREGIWKNRRVEFILKQR
ncbi:MAG: FlgD immunoglobulin-like domain containing protein, partial [Spirochaetota bacterium]